MEKGKKLSLLWMKGKKTLDLNKACILYKPYDYEDFRVASYLWVPEPNTYIKIISCGGRKTARKWSGEVALNL